MTSVLIFLTLLFLLVRTDHRTVFPRIALSLSNSTLFGYFFHVIWRCPGKCLKTSDVSKLDDDLRLDKKQYGLLVKDIDDDPIYIG